jgi:hypothetical protein
MPIELDQPSEPFEPVSDGRPKIPEPLPVKLVAVADVRIKATTGLRLALDAFYVGVLGFAAADDPEAWVYQAQNFQVIVESVEGLVERVDYRPVMVIVDSLATVLDRLNEREIPYERQRGLQPGEFSVLVLDPSGNGVELSEERLIL